MRSGIGGGVMVVIGVIVLIVFVLFSGRGDDVVSSLKDAANIASSSAPTVAEKMDDVAEASEAAAGAISEQAGELPTLKTIISAASAKVSLDTLDTSEATHSGYSNELFGDGWVDVNRNGCDTFNDILARDLTDLRRDGTCRVTGGTLTDPYTAAVLQFAGDAITVDHVVSASNAWNAGAAGWDSPRRAEFANDPLNLIAVSSPAAEKRGGAAANAWLPDNADYRCDYTARQIAVKAKYHLAVTGAERAALTAVLGACS